MSSLEKNIFLIMLLLPSLGSSVEKAVKLVEETFCSYT